MTKGRNTARRDRRAQTARVLVVILVLNLVVAAAKAVYGGWSGSFAVSSDALHSMLDAISNVVGLIALGYAQRPPDPAHPYGYSKAEVVASVAIGAVIAVGAFEFGAGATTRLFRDHPPVEVSAVGVGVLVATLGVNVFVTAFEARAAARLKSPILAADAAHTAADVVVTVVVLGSQGAVYAGWGWADTVATLVVLAVILTIALRIIRDNALTLLDRAVLDPDRVRSLALAIPGVRGCHRVRSRGLSDNVVLDMHMMADASLTLGEAHDLSHQVEEKLRDEFPQLGDVTIHVEPHDDHVDPL